MISADKTVLHIWICYGGWSSVFSHKWIKNQENRKTMETEVLC